MRRLYCKPTFPGWIEAGTEPGSECFDGTCLPIPAQLAPWMVEVFRGPGFLVRGGWNLAPTRVSTVKVSDRNGRSWRTWATGAIPLIHCHTGAEAFAPDRVVRFGSLDRQCWAYGRVSGVPAYRPGLPGPHGVISQPTPRQPIMNMGRARRAPNPPSGSLSLPAAKQERRCAVTQTITLYAMWIGAILLCLAIQSWRSK
jgi:hypothetical protein